MPDEAKRRLIRLQDDLLELQDMAGYPPFGLAVITSTLSKAIHDRKTWAFVQKRVAETRNTNPIVLEPKPIWAEPFTDGMGCIRWCGNSENVERFKGWADRLSRVLCRYDELVPDMDVQEGSVAGLMALFSVATSTDKLAELIEQRTILDLSARINEISGLPRTLAHCDPPPVFTVQDVHFFGLHCASKVLAHLLGEPSKAPRFVVDFNKRQVTLDGITYQPDVVYVALLDLLANANGLPMTRNMLRQAHPLLHDEERIERVVTKLQKEYPDIGDIVKRSQSKPSGFWIPAEYLA